MLPLGRKNARRCTECDITCHANCAHLVPDFCGMSMETANQLLAEIQKVKTSKSAGAKQGQVPRTQKTLPIMEQLPQSTAYGQNARPQVEDVRRSMDNMRFSNDERPPMEYPYGRPQSQIQSPQDRYPPADSYSMPQAMSPSGMPPYPYPSEQSNVARIPPGAKVPAPVPYGDPSMMPPDGRPTSGYDRYAPPSGPDGYPASGYEVSVTHLPRFLLLMMFLNKAAVPATASLPTEAVLAEPVYVSPPGVAARPHNAAAASGPCPLCATCSAAAAPTATVADRVAKTKGWTG